MKKITIVLGITIGMLAFNFLCFNAYKIILAQHKINKMCKHLDNGTSYKIDDFYPAAHELGLLSTIGDDYFSDGRPTLHTAHAYDGFLLGLWHCIVEIQADEVKSRKIFFEPFPELF